jgi:pyrrolidone-carboxylate peptidase
MGDYDPSTIAKNAASASTLSSSSPSRVIKVLVTGFGVCFPPILLPSAVNIVREELEPQWLHLFSSIEHWEGTDCLKPFKSNPVNASFLVASSLPSSITLPPKDTGLADDPEATRPYELLIHTHPSPVPVAYASVRQLLPVILKEFADKNDGARPDLIVHMGIAATREHFAVETQAHRDHYRISDVDGKVGYEDGERVWRAHGLPELLKPGPAEESDGKLFHSSLPSSPKVVPYPANEHFLETWKSFAPETADIRVSDDAGRYLCEFIFFTSMALAQEAGRERAIVFYHIPGRCDEKSVQTGKEVAVALIKTMARCWVDEANLKW